MKQRLAKYNIKEAEQRPLQNTLGRTYIRAAGQQEAA
jgi:hypothetical protein